MTSFADAGHHGLPRLLAGLEPGGPMSLASHLAVHGPMPSVPALQLIEEVEHHGGWVTVLEKTEEEHSTIEGLADLIGVGHGPGQLVAAVIPRQAGRQRRGVDRPGELIMRTVRHQILRAI